MKRIISITLLLALCLSLVACGGKKSDPVTGVYTSGEYTFVLYDANEGLGLAFNSDEYEEGKYNTPSLVNYTVDGDSITVGGESYALSALTKSSAVAFPENINVSVDESVAYIVPPATVSIPAGRFEETSVKAILITTGDELTLDNGSLKSKDGIDVVIAPGVDPNKISVAKNLLEGTEGVTFYIPKESLSTFKSHYNWSQFKDNMIGY